MAGREAWYAGTTNGLFLVERESAHATIQSIGLQGAGGFRAPVVVDCSDPVRLYAGTTRAGVFRSDDAGQTWCEINHGITYKDIWSLVQHPATGRLYAGTSPAYRRPRLSLPNGGTALTDPYNRRQPLHKETTCQRSTTTTRLSTSG